MITPQQAQSNSKSLTINKMFKKSLAALALILTLAAFGCSTTTPEEEVPENIENILAAHPNVYIPANTEWERTLYSGPVEQHELLTLLPQDEFMDDVRVAMIDWELVSDVKNGLQFTNEELRVSYNISPSEESVTNYTLFIEPVDLFGEDHEEYEQPDSAGTIEIDL